MSEQRLMQILLSPVVSEKSSAAADAHNQYVFKVRQDAVKPEIKQAVELMFGVKVKDVTVSNMQGKRKRFGQLQGRRSNWKKAYVRLEADQEINFMGGQ